jgi:hypothetical protein
VFNNDINNDFIEEDSDESVDEFASDNVFSKELKAKLREVQVIHLETVNLADL